MNVRTSGCSILVLAAALAAAEPAAGNTLPDSGEFVCQNSALGECNFTDRASGLQFYWQGDWPLRQLRLVTETGPAAKARQRDASRWIALEYLPDDPAQPTAPLFRVAVLRWRDWFAQSAQPVPFPAVEVAAGREYVAVASVLPANPYPPGSRDADIFDALLPGATELSLIVRFPPRR